MKRYTACLLDTVFPDEHPFESSINQYKFSCDTYSEKQLQDSLLNITNCKRRFGFICGESDYKNLGSISHLVTNVRWEGAQIWCDIMVLDTKNGKLLETLLDAGMQFCLVYNFYSFYTDNATIDVKAIDNNTNPDCEHYILKRIVSKENLEKIK